MTVRKLISHRRAYASADLKKIKKLISAHDFCSEELLKLTSAYPENIMLEMKDERVLSICVHDAQVGKEWCSVYIFTLKDDLQFFYESLSEIRKNYNVLEIVVCLEKSNPLCQKLMYDDRLKPKVITRAFELENNDLIKQDLSGKVKFETYSDDVYDEYQRLINRNFQEISDKLGCNLLSYTCYSEYKRKYFLHNAKDFFYVRRNNKIIASAYAGGGLIDYLAVDKEYRHQGIIKEFILFAMNKFVDEKIEVAKLELDECNFKAVKFYESFGFNVTDEIMYFFY